MRRTASRSPAAWRWRERRRRQVGEQTVCRPVRGMARQTGQGQPTRSVRTLSGEAGDRISGADMVFPYSRPLKAGKPSPTPASWGLAGDPMGLLPPGPATSRVHSVPRVRGQTWPATAEARALLRPARAPKAPGNLPAVGGDRRRMRGTAHRHLFGGPGRRASAASTSARTRALASTQVPSIWPARVVNLCIVLHIASCSAAIPFAAPAI